MDGFTKVRYALRMKRLAAPLVILLLALPIAGAPQKTAHRRILCESPENAASCYWIHGRLSFYNGTPSYRLWRTGTRRLLGIYSGPSVDRLGLDNEDPEFPAIVRQKFKPSKNQIFGDFEVCPLEPQKDGAMQAACIESAKNIVVEN